MEQNRSNLSICGGGVGTSVFSENNTTDLSIKYTDSKTKHIHRPLVKSAYQKINFLISQPKHMLWVLKRTISMRRFF